MVATESDFSVVSFDGGVTSADLLAHLNDKIRARRQAVAAGDVLELNNVWLYFAKIWVPVNINLSIHYDAVQYLKFVSPSQFFQMRDHIQKDVAAMHLEVEVPGFNFDATYIQIDDAPVFTGLNVAIEQHLPMLSRIDLPNFMPLAPNL
jgi:hypothetical protein